MEGNINSFRLISMMRVEEDQLVFDEKANYALEKFLLARRLMYWQVYLHKTSLLSELLLVKTLHRARQYIQEGNELKGSQSLLTLLGYRAENFSVDEMDWSVFLSLDDSDIWYSLKQWQLSDDFILRDLSKRLIQRNLFGIAVQDSPFAAPEIIALEQKWSTYYGSKEIASSFVFTGSVSNQTYSSKKHPLLLQSTKGEIRPIHMHPGFATLMKYTESQTLYYLCSPKA